eukprot:m.6656 g.6656  ORF g.6656 m.6656 type:complete len:59 (+) comp16524_c0_seq1:214-390(+)
MLKHLPKRNCLIFPCQKNVGYFLDRKVSYIVGCGGVTSFYNVTTELSEITLVSGSWHS